jgi:hypothetical protein
MNFGVPSQRKVKQEAYPDNAIITMGVDGGKGKSRQLTFNKRASELLSINDKSRIAFAFSPEGGVAIANTDQNGIDPSAGIRVTKSKPRKVSDKKTYDYIKKILDLDTSVETLFEVQLSEDGDGFEMYDVLPFIAVDKTLVVDVETFIAHPGGSFAKKGLYVTGASPFDITEQHGSSFASAVDDSVESAHSLKSGSDSDIEQN